MPDINIIIDVTISCSDAIDAMPPILASLIYCHAIITLAECRCHYALRRHERERCYMLYAIDHFDMMLMPPLLHARTMMNAADADIIVVSLSLLHVMVPYAISAMIIDIVIIIALRYATSCCYCWLRHFTF